MEKMDYNFEMLLERIMDANEVTDLKKVKRLLELVNDTVLCVGVGGSKVVADYASKVLSKKNGCFCKVCEPRDTLYEEATYKNVFVASYKGENYGVDVALTNEVERFLFTNGDIYKEGVNTIRYYGNLEKENSYISLAATLVPMSILLHYYVGDDFEDLLNDMMANLNIDQIKSDDKYAIMSGYDTSVAATYLESTMVEAGLGYPIIHSKYDFCHGRPTLAKENRDTLIYLKNRTTELDELLLALIPSRYKQKIILESNYSDIVIDNFNLTLKAMYLTKMIAENQGKDLSDVQYDKGIVYKVYNFKRGM